jgi:hypothetical protein
MQRITLAPVAQPESSRWLFAALTAAFWYEVLWLGAVGSDALTIPPAVAAAAGLASQLAFTALEASLGVAAWSVLGARVRWSALAPRLLAVSAAEAAAVAIAAGRPALAAPWGMLLAGTRADPHAMPQAALAQTFATFGLLTLVRFALAIHTHASTARVDPRRAAMVVLGFYLASRCAMWWTLDLMRGHSFESEGLG